MCFGLFQIFSHCQNLQVQSDLYSNELQTYYCWWMVSSLNNSSHLHSSWQGLCIPARKILLLYGGQNHVACCSILCIHCHFYGLVVCYVNVFKALKVHDRTVANNLRTGNIRQAEHLFEV